MKERYDEIGSPFMFIDSCCKTVKVTETTSQFYP